MKNKIFKVFSLFFLILLLFSCSNFNNKQILACKVDATQNNNSEVIVSGESHICLKADIVKITANICETNESLENAKNITFEKLNTAKQFLLSMGVSENGIVVNYFTTYAVYDNSYKNIQGYNSNLSFVFMTSSENCKQIIDGLNEVGITNIGNIEYKVKNYEEEYTKLLSSAVDNAVEKAKSILNKQEITIKKVIEQETFNYCSMLKNVEYDNCLDSQVEITARVRVVVE